MLQLVTGRVWKGTAFGGYKSRVQVGQGGEGRGGEGSTIHSQPWCVCIAASSPAVVPTPPNRLQVPDLVELYQRGETMLDEYITHRLPFDGGCALALEGGARPDGASVICTHRANVTASCKNRHASCEN